MKIYGDPGSNTKLGAVQAGLGGGASRPRGSGMTLTPSGSASHLPAYVPPASTAPGSSPATKARGGAAGAAGGAGGSIAMFKAGKKWTKKG